jgi:hypothetical protein
MNTLATTLQTNFLPSLNIQPFHFPTTSVDCPIYRRYLPFIHTPYLGDFNKKLHSLQPVPDLEDPQRPKWPAKTTMLLSLITKRR